MDLILAVLSIAAAFALGHGRGVEDGIDSCYIKFIALSDGERIATVRSNYKHMF